jgi:serine/threonine-protein kinase RsbW
MADNHLSVSRPEAPPADTADDALVRAFDRRTLITVRHDVQVYSASAGLADLALYNFVMAVNEIMTNAVHHGGGTGQLRLWGDERHIHCLITDQGRGIPQSRMYGQHRPKPGTIGGWGLWLARQICDEVDVKTGRTGTRILLRYHRR